MPAELVMHRNVSGRSLRRRLVAQVGSCRQWLDAWRRSRAVELQVNGHRSVAEAAQQAGFAHIGSFRRAFERWTCANPALTGPADVTV